MCSQFSARRASSATDGERTKRKISLNSSRRAGIEGSPLDSGEIWAVVTLAAANQTSVWETCKDNDNAPCDDTVMDWLHTLNREWLERIANDLLKEMVMTILDPDRSRIVSIDFVDNPYHGDVRR